MKAELSLKTGTWQRRFRIVDKPWQKTEIVYRYVGDATGEQEA